VEHPETGELLEVVPGNLRKQDVTVGSRSRQSSPRGGCPVYFPSSGVKRCGDRICQDFAMMVKQLIQEKNTPGCPMR